MADLDGPFGDQMVTKLASEVRLMNRSIALILTLISQIYGGLVLPGVVLCIHDDGALRLEAEGTLCCSKLEDRAVCRHLEDCATKHNQVETGSSVAMPVDPSECACRDVPLASSRQPSHFDSPTFELPRLAANPVASVLMPPPSEPCRSFEHPGNDPPGIAFELLLSTTVILC